MTIDDELSKISSLFIDTAPIIYYIEAHPQFGPLSKNIRSLSFRSHHGLFVRRHPHGSPGEAGRSRR
jgi:hypothetical protein